MILLVLTCPGRGYLPSTLRKLEAQDWNGDRIVWSDGDLPTDLDLSAWKPVARPHLGPPKNNTLAFWGALEFAYESATDHLLMVQDDVTPSRGALRYIERLGVPNELAYVSWFDPIGKALTSNIPIGMRVTGETLLPAQARSYGRRAIQKLLAAREDKKAHVLDDVFVADVMRDEFAGVHLPSLFRHDGIVSAIAGAPLAGMRESASWLGESYDVSRGFKHIMSRDLWGSI